MGGDGEDEMKAKKRKKKLRCLVLERVRDEAIKKTNQDWGRDESS